MENGIFWFEKVNLVSNVKIKAINASKERHKKTHRERGSRAKRPTDRQANEVSKRQRRRPTDGHADRERDTKSVANGF